MAHVEPLSREDLPEFEGLFRATERAGGYIVNSILTMGRRPEMLRTWIDFFRTVMGPGLVSQELKQLVAHVASTSAGCRYCQAHTAGAAELRGVSVERVEAVYEFESSPLFDEAERAALRLGRDAALLPNLATSEHFEALREHFSDDEIVELVAAIAIFGFLNRWNDTMATALEEEPLSFASEHLRNAGWEPGKHRP